MNTKLNTTLVMKIYSYVQQMADLIHVYSVVKVIHKALEIFYNTVLFLISHISVKNFIR